MKNKSIIVIQKMQTIVLALVFFITPLIFSKHFLVSFEFPKTIFFRLMVTILVFLITYEIAISKGVFTSFKRYVLSNLYLIVPLIFLVYSFISTFFRDHFLLTLLGSENRLYGFVSLLYMTIFLYLLIFLFHRPINRQVALKYSILSALIAIIIGVLQMNGLVGLLNTALPFESTRMFSTIGHPNVFATFLIILYPLSLIYFQHNRYYKIIFILLTVLFLASVYFTNSRIAMLISVFESIIALWIFSKNYIYRTIVTFVIPILLFLFVFGFKLLSFRLMSLETLNTRLLIWESAFRAIIDAPLFGYGYESFKNISYKYVDKTIGILEYAQKIPDRAHNLLLDKLIENGLIGVLLSLVFFIVLIYKLSFIRSNKSKLLLVSFLTSTIMMMFNFQTIVINLYLVLVLALSIDLISKWSEQKENLFSFLSEYRNKSFKFGNLLPFQVNVENRVQNFFLRIKYFGRYVLGGLKSFICKFQEIILKKSLKFNFRKLTILFIVFLIITFSFLFIYLHAVFGYDLRNSTKIQNSNTSTVSRLVYYLHPSSLLTKVDLLINDTKNMDNQGDIFRKLEESDEYMNLYLDITGDNKIYFHKRALYYRKLNLLKNLSLDKSIILFREAIKYQPWNPELYGELVVTAIMANRGDVSSLALENFVRYLPSDKRILEMRDYKLKRLKDVIYEMYK